QGLRRGEADRRRGPGGDHGLEGRAAVGECRIGRHHGDHGTRLLVLRRRGQSQHPGGDGALFLRAGPGRTIAAGRGDVRVHHPGRDTDLRGAMAVQLICCSHSPLMTTDVEESEANVHAAFFSELDSCAAALRAFNPDLVVVFGPDHFNGFFYELMPAFCIGTAAEGTKDWHLESGPLRVPREIALACVRYLQTRDFDVAISHQMKVDHGITIPLFKLTGALARYPVLPVFINCAADPRPSFRRVRAFGEAMGEFLAAEDLRITLVGSGGLSPDPPPPRLAQSPPDPARRLI